MREVRVAICPVNVLARDEQSFVDAWQVELTRRNRLLISFVITADLQLWHNTHWWRDRAPDWWRTWWSR